jgi:hypothetical protein
VGLLDEFYICRSVHDQSILLNNKRYAALSSRIVIHSEITLHVSGAFCTHHQEYIKTVDAIAGASHVSLGASWFELYTKCYVQCIVGGGGG